MKALQAIAGALLALILSGALAAQTRPDFSGVWTPVDSQGRPATPPPPPPRPPAGRPPPPPAPRTISTTIAQTSSELKVERRVETGGREAVYTFVYKLDGTESVNQMEALLFTTKATWEDGALVLSSVASVEGKTVGQVKDVYRLRNDELIIETTRRTPAGTFTSRGTHRRDVRRERG